MKPLTVLYGCSAEEHKSLWTRKQQKLWIFAINNICCTAFFVGLASSCVSLMIPFNCYAAITFCFNLDKVCFFWIVMISSMQLQFAGSVLSKFVWLLTCKFLAGDLAFFFQRSFWSDTHLGKSCCSWNDFLLCILNATCQPQMSTAIPLKKWLFGPLLK